MTDDEQMTARKLGGEPFSVAELSDGERNALLIAIMILTAKPGTLVLVDEPERHLHRSIISPLLSHLFSRRPDCSFVISTHDLDLAADSPDSISMLIRGCSYTGTSATSWDADIVAPEIGLEDDLRTAILGARRRLLFIEGTERSMDKPLYSLVFPDVTVIPKSSCRDVEHSVSQLRDSELLHWVRAFGIVDQDRRVPSDISRLQEKGIYAVPAFSVESIYYHPEVQRKIAQRQESLMVCDAEVLLGRAKQSVVSSVTPHIQRLSERAAEKVIREALFEAMPTNKTISKGLPIQVEIDVAAFVETERKQLEMAISNENIEYIIARYPVRETPTLSAIAFALRFQTRADYESAVLKLLQDDLETLTFVRGLFDTLYDDIIQS
jgi:energy-coupling factor transporter ATP-binding protein EcfA2